MRKLLTLALFCLLVTAGFSAATVTLTWTQVPQPADWAASTLYASGQTICPLSGNAGLYIFFPQFGSQFSGGGNMTSGTSEPTWPQTAGSQTAADGGIVDWENTGLACIVDSNNVYRGSQHDGPYTKIYSSSAPITTYNNISVAPGTYYYVVTAVSSKGETMYSNEATAIVPGSSTPVPRSGRGSTF